jgi:cell division protein FtsW
MQTERAAILIIVLVLLSIGLMMIYNSSAVLASEDSRYDNDPMYFLKKQLMWLSLAILVFLPVVKIHYGFFLRYSRTLTAGALFLLALVFVPGIRMEINGAKRWISIFGVSIQPSEIAAYALIVYLAHYLSFRRRKLKKFWKGFVPPLIVSAAFIIAITMQPKLGAVLVMSVVTAIMFFAGGCRLKHLLLTGTAVVAGVVLLVLTVLYVPMPHRELEGYRQKAITQFSYVEDRLAFTNPEKYKDNETFQLYQSLVGLGSGGVKGVGFAEGKQKHYLTFAIYNDFIGSIVGEELGFVGLCVIVLAYAGITILGFRIALHCKDIGGYLLAVGVASNIAVNAFFHIGVVSGLLPTTGLNLPFISSGGSNLLMNMFGIGILMSVGGHKAQLRKRKPSAITSAPVKKRKKLVMAFKW